MDQFSELRSVGQIDSSEAGRVFREFLRSQVRQSLVNIMTEEVRELCGPKYRPATEADCRRAGVAPGVVLCEGRRERIARPRVRRTKQDGSTEEVRLVTYASAQESGQLDDMLLRAIIAGASGRRRANCGRSSRARTMGPATSCGKNDTYRKKSRKLAQGASRPR